MNNQIMDALGLLLTTVITGGIGVISTMVAVYFNNLKVKLQAETKKIENEETRKLINTALDRLNDLVVTNVQSANETLVKEIKEQSKDGYDKSDLILYIAKILTVSGKKVLFLDTTLMQKTRYIVPTMTPAQKYVTTYDGIDIAIGFYNMQDLKEYFSIDGELKYDFVLADIDSPEAYINFGFNQIDLHYLVTSFDVFSLQRGISVLKAFKVPTQVTKVLFTRDPESEEKEYIDFVSMSYKVRWNEDVLYFPFETSDLYAIYVNQRFSKVRFDNLSMEYMDCLAFMAEQISGLSKSDIKKAIRIIERA